MVARLGFVLFLALLSTPASGNDIVDLQDLLKNVQYTMKRVTIAMDTCSANMQPAPKTLPRDCADIWNSGVRTNGIHRIWPQGNEKDRTFEVYCDMKTDGGGWTVFQKRGDYGNSQDYFFKTWDEYKNGFGQLDKEFWLGNDRISALTTQDVYEMRVDLWDMEKKRNYAQYSSFWVENEDQQYRMKIKGYSGNAGDGLAAYANDMMFSTKDRKNDNSENHCAQTYKGGWWYNACHSANLNGLNLRGLHKTYGDGIEWGKLKGHYYSFAATEMKIRPADFFTSS